MRSLMQHSNYFAVSRQAWLIMMLQCWFGALKESVSWQEMMVIRPCHVEDSACHVEEKILPAKNLKLKFEMSAICSYSHGIRM